MTGLPFVFAVWAGRKSVITPGVVDAFQQSCRFGRERIEEIVAAESGRREIYVKPYPGPGGKWQVSTDGGTEPMWNRNSREIFYRTGAKMMAVEVNAARACA